MERTSKLIRAKYGQYLLSTISMSAALYLAVLVDSILVGNILGGNELAAVNLCNPVAFVSNSIFCVMIYGGTTVASMHIGSRDRQGSNAVFTLSMAGCLVLQLVFTAVCLVLSGDIAGVLSQNGSLKGLVWQYLIPFVISIPIIGISSGMAAFARVDGFTGLSAAIPIVSNVVNLSLDVVFMSVFHMGIAGAGWATVCGYTIGVVMLVPYLISSKRSFRWTKKIKTVSACFAYFKDIFLTGLPTSLTNVCSFIRTIVVNSIILSAMGAEGIQILTICLNSSALISIVAQGAGNTILPIAGALYGEKDTKGIVYAFKAAMRVSVGITSAFILFFELCPTVIATLCGIRDPGVMAHIIPAFRVYVLSFLAATVIYQMKSLYQASNNRKVASFVSVIEGAAVIVPTLLVLSQINVNLIWAAFLIAELISLVVTLVYVRCVAKKKKLSPYLLLNTKQDEKLLDVTIENSIDSAEELSQNIIDFCTENGVAPKYAGKLGAAAEEITVNIAQYAYKKKKQNIDVTVRILEDSIVLKVRDDGTIFNPLTVEPEENAEISGIEFVKKVADKFTYNRVVGFNVVLVTIRR